MLVVGGLHPVAGGMHSGDTQTKEVKYLARVPWVLPVRTVWNRCECSLFHHPGLWGDVGCVVWRQDIAFPHFYEVSHKWHIQKDPLQWAVRSNDLLTWEAWKNIFRTRELRDMLCELCLSNTITLIRGKAEDPKKPPIPGGDNMVRNCDFLSKGVVLTLMQPVSRDLVFLDHPSET